MGYFGRPARRGAIMMALAACVALAVADNRYRGIADQDAWAMDETTGSSPRDNHAPADLALQAAAVTFLQRLRRCSGTSGARTRCPAHYARERSVLALEWRLASSYDPPAL